MNELKTRFDIKAKFVSQYYGQFVLRFLNNDDKLKVIDWFKFDKGYLELTPLHLISDEDKIELGKILGFKESETCPLFVAKVKGNTFIESLEYGHSYQPGISISAYQYLLQRGVALNYYSTDLGRVIPVAEQVELGWVELKKE